MIERLKTPPDGAGAQTGEAAPGRLFGGVNDCAAGAPGSTITRWSS